MKQKISSNSSGKSGNTKQISPSIRWTFTLNNYEKKEIEELERVSSNSSKYCIFGFEIGENKTPHLQGYIEFKNKVRPVNMFECKRYHWEKAKGNREHNYAYCSKDGHFVLNGVENKPVKIINELYPWQKKLYDILLTEPDDRTIHWIYEEKGNVGKTAFLKYVAVKQEKTTLVLCGKANDMKNGVLKFKEKMGYYPKILLFNLPRSFKCEHLSLPGIEEIKDGLFYCGKYEGGMVKMNSPHIMIMSNTPFEDLRLDDVSPERWNIIKL